MHAVPRRPIVIYPSRFGLLILKYNYFGPRTHLSLSTAQPGPALSPSTNSPQTLHKLSSGPSSTFYTLFLSRRYPWPCSPHHPTPSPGRAPSMTATTATTCTDTYPLRPPIHMPPSPPPSCVPSPQLGVLDDRHPARRSPRSSSIEALAEPTREDAVEQSNSRAHRPSR
ncbi:hypothetical protein C8Q80DRAFT_830655 [Daedaleopsis nitida]|nr:hypothetical protein C8Q80DRAFT_830655 [Daedaleopsis nitida]